MNEFCTNADSNFVRTVLQLNSGYLMFERIAAIYNQTKYPSIFKH